MTNNNRIIRCPALCAVVVLVCLAARPAAADDLNIPEYYGDPLSVFVAWIDYGRTSGIPTGKTEFDLSAFESYPPDDPSIRLHADLPSYDVVTTDQGNLYSFHIPNWIGEDLPLGLLRIQMTWSGPEEPIIQQIGPSQDGMPTAAQLFHYNDEDDPYHYMADGYAYADYHLRPSPDYQNVTILGPGNTHLLHVLFDSHARLPEPASVAGLTLGVTALIGRRRRQG
jgi:hypothetical protein